MEASEEAVESVPSPGSEDDCSVCVAVHIRPLIESELADGCQACLSVAGNQPQVFAGTHSFTYDHVFGGGGVVESSLYGSCVLPLVEGLFKGYNATVFAYGQTGSGKTYTMGSAFTPGGTSDGVIPQVMDSIFSKTASTAGTEFTIRVGFVEIHTEEIRDLLILDAHGGRSVHIREVPGGGICLAGATEKEVGSKAEMAELLSQGTLQRATAATSMNRHSSRSHAIFTITVEQRRKMQPAARRPDSDAEDDGTESGDEDMDEYLCAKMHLVDLAGSERTKRTKAEGQRLKEGININKGLLALGNVISALSEGKPHVPYRDSKLTRMLQDSLGGNSRTVMIACVSPADLNLEESLNTLRYANRARNIRNKPVINRDPNAAQLAHLRQQLAAAKAEIASLKKRQNESGVEARPWNESAAPVSDELMAAVIDEMQIKISKLDVDNARLRVELESARQELKEAAEKLLSAEAERDAKSVRLEQLAVEQGLVSEPSALEEDVGTMRKHLQRISALEAEVRRLRKVQKVSGAWIVSTRKQAPGLTPQHSQSSLHEPFSPLPMADLGLCVGVDGEEPGSLADDEEFAAEEQAFRVEQQKAASELDKLQQALASKEAQMARVVSGDGQIATLKKHYDQKLSELQGERDELQKERLELLQRMQQLRSSKTEDRTALEAKYRQKLKEMDERLRLVTKQERRFAHIEGLQAKSQETCRRLQGDIQAIKQQKVQLMKSMEKSQKDFQQWKKERERELLALKRQGRKAAAHVQRLESLQAKQQAVLRRKTEEAEAARKRLKEMMEVHQRASEVRMLRPVASKPSGVEAQPNPNAPLLRDEKARREWIEHELDLCCQSFEIQRVLDGEKAQRSETARQLQDLERRLMTASAEKQASLRQKQAPLKELLNQQSAQILETQQQLMRAKAEEDQRGQAAADARRWNGLKTIVEARSLLKSVFKVAATQKSQVYEGQSELAEAREELEMLRLKLEAAVQEASDAQQAAARAQSALAEALTAPHADEDDSAPLPDSPRDDMEDTVETLLEEIDGAEHAAAHGSPPEARAAPKADHEYLSGHESEGSEEDEEEEEEEDDVWDPSTATPMLKPRGRQRSEGGNSRGFRMNLLQADAEELDGELRRTRDELEHPVLMDVNHERSKQGDSPVVKLTVPVLKAHLRGKLLHGREWRLGSKKREELIEDYRDYLGLKDRSRMLRANPASSSHPSDSQPSSVVSRSPGQSDQNSGSCWRSSDNGDTGSMLDGAAGDSLDSLEHQRQHLPRLRTQLTAQPVDEEVKSPVAAKAEAGTPTAISYETVKQKCQVAMMRAQALRSRVQAVAALQPSAVPSPGLPPLRIPPVSPRSSPDETRCSSAPHAAANPTSTRDRHPDDHNLDGDREGDPGSPARHVLGATSPPRAAAERMTHSRAMSEACIIGRAERCFAGAGEIANAGEVSSPLGRSYEKGLVSQPTRGKRSQPPMRSGGGQLSARQNKASFVSPRPRAAWL